MKNLLMTMTANQMMKGIHRGEIKASATQKKLFLKRHEKNIEWVVDQLPRISAAVHAVMVKCLIKYGEERVRDFCTAIREVQFNGLHDPAHMLWKFLLKEAGRDTNLTYRKTVAAAKAYMENKTLEFMRAADTDVFEWDEDWTVPDELLKTWKPELESTNEKC